jgi:hypothetical protein
MMSKSKVRKMIKRSGTDYGSITDIEKRFVTAKVLDPVISEGQIKDAVIDMITDLKNDEDTHYRMLYILLTLSNPFLSYDDMLFLQYRDWIRRRQRRVSMRMWNYLYGGLGLAVSSCIWYAVNLFG